LVEDSRAISKILMSFETFITALKTSPSQLQKTFTRIARLFAGNQRPFHYFTTSRADLIAGFTEYKVAGPRNKANLMIFQSLYTHGVWHNCLELIKNCNDTCALVQEEYGEVRVCNQATGLEPGGGVTQLESGHRLAPHRLTSWLSQSTPAEHTLCVA
jgi:hypothetical protein